MVSAANLFRYRTVFEIRGNDNLMELWPAPQNDSGIQIVVEGIVRFVLNRHLCPQRIIDLVKTGALVLPGGRGFRSEELELAQTSNGKLGFCELPSSPVFFDSYFGICARFIFLYFYYNFLFIIFLLAFL